MSKPLAISQRQVQSLLRAAEAEHGIVEVKLGSTILRLIPSCLAKSVSSAVDDDSDPSSFKTLDDYRAWRDKNAGGLRD